MPLARHSYCADGSRRDHHTRPPRPPLRSSTPCTTNWPAACTGCIMILASDCAPSAQSDARSSACPHGFPQLEFASSKTYQNRRCAVAQRRAERFRRLVAAWQFRDFASRPPKIGSSVRSIPTRSRADTCPGLSMSPTRASPSPTRTRRASHAARERGDGRGSLDSLFGAPLGRVLVDVWRM